MVAETGSGEKSGQRKLNLPKLNFGVLGRFFRWLQRYSFSSLSRRIFLLNLAALIMLVGGILYLNKFRAGLIDARVQSLLTQGEIIAGAVAAAATVDTNSIIIDPDRLLELRAGETISPADEELKRLEFPINPERAAPILRRLISPTHTRARVFDREGVLIVDTRNLYSRGQILSFDLLVPKPEKTYWVTEQWNQFANWIFSSDLPLQKELAGENGKGYPEVVAALRGASVTVVRVNKKREIIVSVAVPVQRFRAVLGALVLSTKGGDIDKIVRAERLAIVQVFLVAVAVTALLSFLLAGTIAGPMRKLARAAERVRRGTKARIEIPDFTNRSDEIGHLSGALRDMTTALYNRIDAIESFAADVAHELKNPLTSLRSAVETLPLAKDKTSRQRLIKIVLQDVRRLDRLISDISDASRLDAELAREEAEPVDMIDLLSTVTMIAGEVGNKNGIKTIFNMPAVPAESLDYFVTGHDSRLGQVIRNLIANAQSFSKKGDKINVTITRKGSEVEVIVADEGPGVRPGNFEKIFERFYADRPGPEHFGENSGLGLSISKQIIEAHGGRIWAENRLVQGVKPSSEQKKKGYTGCTVCFLHSRGTKSTRACKTGKMEKEETICVNGPIIMAESNKSG